MQASIRRALLLGARAPDLSGVDHDLELMREALHHHGFADENIETVVPATRDFMVAAIKRLIDRTQRGDVVVFYYSGHGSKLDANDDYQFLVPTDIEASTDTDFRGYTNIELSLDLAALTRKTRNAVMIMDCCHAGRIFRDEKSDETGKIAWQDTTQYLPARSVNLTGPWARAAAGHYARLQANRADELSSREAEANPWAVQLLASQSNGPAFEAMCPPRAGCDHRRAGAMTLALHAALMKVDATRTTWQDLGRMIRMTPRRGGQEQQVTVEGPYRRFLFSLAEREPFGQVDIEFSEGRIFLAGGRLAGLAEGDRFEVRALESGSFQKIGEAEVTRVRSSYAEVTTDVQRSERDGPCYAHPTSYGAPRASVEIVGVEPGSLAREFLEDRLRTSGLTRVLAPGESAGEQLPLAGQLRFEQGKLQLWSNGVAFDVPRPFDIRNSKIAGHLATHMADGVRRLARASSLRTLPEPKDDERLEPCWEIDRSTFRLTCSRALYHSVLRIGADAQIELLTRAQGGGVEMVPGQSYLVGQRSGSSSAELIVERPSIIVLVLSDRPVDLRSWVQAGLSRFALRDSLAPESFARNVSPPPKQREHACYHVETWTFDVT